MEQETKEYWLKKEDDSGEFDYIDQDGVSHNNPAEWLWSFLGGCGCGSSQYFAERSVKLLEYFATDHLARNTAEVNPYENEVDELLAHWMDSVGLLEHGTSVSSSWLTEKGQQIHESITKLK